MTSGGVLTWFIIGNPEEDVVSVCFDYLFGILAQLILIHIYDVVTVHIGRFLSYTCVLWI